MPDIASVLKQEIMRLARKEVAVIVQPQSKQIQSLEASIRNLPAQVATLEKTLSRWSTDTPSTSSQSQTEAKLGKVIRISPKSIKSHRRRLNL